MTHQPRPIVAAGSMGEPPYGQGSARAAGALFLALACSRSAAERPGQRLMAGHDYANTRYRKLEEITSRNVGGLKVAWTFSTGVLRGQEAAPIVAGSTMFIVTPFPEHPHPG